MFLVEDHASFRQSMAMVLEAEGVFEVVGQAGTIAEACSAIKTMKKSRKKRKGVDLGALDLNLPDGEGVDLIAEFRKLSPQFAALVLTASFDESEHARAIESGAAAVLNKMADLDEIVDSMKRLGAGETLMSAGELTKMLRRAASDRDSERRARDRRDGFTKREMQVLATLSEGKSNKEIAEELRISVDTERTHMVNILNKLGAHSRLQALIFAARKGIIKIERE